MDFSSRDIKTGLFVLLAMAILFVGVWFAGAPVGRIGPKKTYLVRFKNMGLLQERTRVAYGGAAVGQVAKIRRLPAMEQDGTVAEAEIRIDRDVVLRQGAKAEIRSDGLIGEKFLDILPGPDPESEILAERSVLLGSMGGLTGVMEQANDLITKLGEVLEVVRRLAVQLPKTVDKLNKAVGHVDDLLELNEGNLTLAITAAKDAVLTLNEILDANKEDLRGAVSGIRQRVDQTEGTVEAVDALIGDARKTLAEILPAIEGSVAKLESLLHKTEGLVVASDPKLLETLDNVRSATRHLDEMILRLKADPSVLIWGTDEEEEPEAATLAGPPEEDRPWMGPREEEP